MTNFIFLAGCLTLLQILLQPHAWKLWVDSVNRPEGCHEHKVCYGTLDRSIGKPWCYRILSAWIVWLGSKAVKNLFVLLVGIRYLQNFLILYLFQKYSCMYGNYNKAGTIALLVAIVIGYIGTDFRLNTHNETIFLLLSFIVGPSWWLLPIAVLAVLNRETYGIFYVPAIIVWGVIPEIVVSLIVFTFVFLLLRFLWPTLKLTCPQHTPGWRLVKDNLTSPASLLNVPAYFGMYHILNVVINPLSIGILAMGFINFVCNLWYGNLRETALFINPYILLIPLMV